MANSNVFWNLFSPLPLFLEVSHITAQWPLFHSLSPLFLALTHFLLPTKKHPLKTQSKIPPVFPRCSCLSCIIFLFYPLGASVHSKITCLPRILSVLFYTHYWFSPTERQPWWVGLSNTRASLFQDQWRGQDYEYTHAPCPCHKMILTVFHLLLLLVNSPWPCLLINTQHLESFILKGHSIL